MSIRGEIRGTAYWITFDNPRKRNAINTKMYEDWCRVLDEANDNDDTILTVFTGAGDFYSSGNDFSYSEIIAADRTDVDHESGFSRVMRRLINHKKVLIGLVNGPAIGFACTTLGMFDYVVCSDSAYFLTPFVTLGITAEGGSSTIFPQKMGTSNANEMLLFREKMSARQALDRHLVSHVFPAAEFIQKATEQVEKFGKLPKDSMLLSKSLMRNENWRREALSTHHAEYDLLRKMFGDQRSIDLVMGRFAKSKQ